MNKASHLRPFLRPTKDNGVDLGMHLRCRSSLVRWMRGELDLGRLCTCSDLTPPPSAMKTRSLAPPYQTMSAQPALVSRATFTKEKIALLCLMNMVFERHSQDRNIPFEEIAARTKLPVDQVRV